MTVARHRRWLLVWLAVAAVCGTGCNVLTLPFFIFGPEPRVPPMMRGFESFAPAEEDEDSEVKVAVLVYGGLDFRPELLRADRELGIQTVRYLKESFKYYKDDVKVVSPTRVEEFKNNHPDWPTMDLDQIGRTLGADYVIQVEINKLSLYDKGTTQLYRGRANVTLSLVNVHDPDAGQLRQEYDAVYPGESSGGFVEVGDKPMPMFRAEFYDYLARHVAWHFVPHPTRQEYSCE